MVIPYASVISFADPSVNFALQLKMLPMDGDDEDFEDGEGFDAEHLDYFDAIRHENGKPGERIADEDDGEAKTGEVITLDAFRKK